MLMTVVVFSSIFTMFSTAFAQPGGALGAVDSSVVHQPPTTTAPTTTAPTTSPSLSGGPSTFESTFSKGYIPVEDVEAKDGTAVVTIEDNIHYLIGALGHAQNRGKLYLFRLNSDNGDASAATLWSRTNGPMRYGFVLDLSIGEILLRQLARYYEFSSNTGFMQSYVGMSGLVGFIIEVPIKFFGALILAVLTLAAYVVQYVGVRIYRLVDVFNVYKMMLGNQTLENVKFEQNNAVSAAEALQSYATILVHTRNMAILVTIFIFALGLFSVVMGIRLANTTGTRSSSGFKVFRAFLARVLILTSIMAFLSASVTGFSALMGESMDDFGIQEEISGLIVDYRGSLTALYKQTGSSVDTAIDNIVASNQKYLVALAKDNGEEIANSEKTLGNIGSTIAESDDSANARTILNHNAQFWLSQKVATLLANYKNNTYLTSKAIREINALKASSDYGLRKFVGMIRDGVNKYLGGTAFGDAMTNALSWAIRANIAKESQDRVLNFFSSDDFRLISGWGLSSVTTPDDIENTYNQASMIARIYGYAPRGLYLESFDPTAKFGNARMYFSDYTIPGVGLALFLYLRVCVVLLTVIILGIKVYRSLFLFLFKFSLQLVGDVVKAVAHGDLAGIIYLFSSFLVMCSVVMGTRIFMWVCITIIRFPQKLFEALVVGPVGVFLQKAPSSSISDLTSPGAILFNVVLTMIICYILVRYVLDPFLEKFEKIMFDVLSEIARRLAMGVRGASLATTLSGLGGYAANVAKSAVNTKGLKRHDDPNDNSGGRMDSVVQTVKSDVETAKKAFNTGGAIINGTVNQIQTYGSKLASRDGILGRVRDNLRSFKDDDQSSAYGKRGFKGDYKRSQYAEDFESNNVSDIILEGEANVDFEVVTQSTAKTPPKTPLVLPENVSSKLAGYTPSVEKEGPSSEVIVVDHLKVRRRTKADQHIEVDSRDIGSNTASKLNTSLSFNNVPKKFHLKQRSKVSFVRLRDVDGKLKIKKR